MVAIRCLTLSLMLALSAPLASALAHAETNNLIGAAIVQPDATLRVHGHRVRLYGIYVPATGQQCRTFLSPTYCGNRAAVALDSKIQGFVFCRTRGRHSDGSVSAFCSVERTFRSPGEDLGAYLVARGLALAGRYAPFEYIALERIAQSRKLGLWGFPADLIIRP